MEAAPSNAPAASMRRPPPPRKTANPMVKPKRLAAPRPQPASSSQRPGGPGPSANGTNPQQSSQPRTTPQNPNVQTQETYEDTPIFASRRAQLEGSRYHIMRLFPSTNVDEPVDPRNQSQFTPPVRLHRRDPRRDPAPTGFPLGQEHEDEKKPNLADDKAREEANIAKAARAMERDANKAQIAPTAKSEAADARKKHRKQKKTEMVYQFTNSETKVKNQRIRYEEAMPWHLEDFDNKNLWAGTYESALSEHHVLLVRDPESKKYSMVPLEKWYKFLPKSHIKTASYEDAERKMRHQQTVPTWMKDAEIDRRKKEGGEQAGKMFTRRGERGEGPSGAGDDERFEQAEDADIIDYDYEEAFADDEENALFGGDDDENKEAEDKIKRERGDANIFKDIKEEKDFDQEEERHKLDEEEEKVKRRRLRRALKKREKDERYDDDSDTESDFSEVDEEANKAKEEEAADGKATQANGLPRDDRANKPSNGVASTGRNTPTGEHIRNQLKRPVSPSQSDLSGNESSRRKKQKKAHTNAGTAATGATISRTGTPVNQAGGPQRPGKIRLNTGTREGAASGSEGEMSDGRRRKKKSQPSSRQVSPGGSRATSPVNAPPPFPAKPAHEYTRDDIVSRVPPEGVPISRLSRIFGEEQIKIKEFQDVIKTHLTMDKQTRHMKPKPLAPPK